MSDEPDIEPETAKKIFIENVHKIAPHHLTENAFRYVKVQRALYACKVVYAVNYTHTVLHCPNPYILAVISHVTRCFDRFFRMVNINERRLVAWRRGFVTEKVDLVGIDYLWRAMLVAPENIVSKPIELLKDVYTNLSTKLQQDQIHSQFIQFCVERLRHIYEGLNKCQPGEIEREGPEMQHGHKSEVNKLVRCLSLLKEYVLDCDEEYNEERCIPPHGK